MQKYFIGQIIVITDKTLQGALWLENDQQPGCGAWLDVTLSHWREWLSRTRGNFITFQTRASYLYLHVMSSKASQLME